MKIENCSREAVAIVGMACIFPKAPDVASFWRNILGSIDAIGEPQEEWEADRYLRSGRVETPSGGYLKDLYRFDPQEFGVMPSSVDGGEPDQFLALRVAREALQDAGYLDPGYDHSETGIVLGHSTYLHRGQVSLIQHHIVLDQTMELLRALFPSLEDGKATRIREILAKKLPPSNADNAPGLVPNVMTGRIANRLNLRGPNYIIDAACASSLLSVRAAADELRNGRSRIMLAGGVNASLPAEASVIFTQLGALSREGKIRPFGAEADGTLLGEGVGIVVLKRLSDAIGDRDRIYALVRGVGVASDGRAYGLLAPNVEGEVLAMERAYAESGVSPATVELVEAHGTGIPLGDRTEILALKRILGERKGGQGSIAIGTVKSMIGHCIPAAGIAGLIKSALALHHKILPPTLCGTIHPELGLERTPLYVNTEARPWISRTGIPRRAGVNAFGFGGINTHAVLEESPVRSQHPRETARRPFELCVFSGADGAELRENLSETAGRLPADAGGGLYDLAARLGAREKKGPHRLAIVAGNAEDLSKKIAQALKRLADASGDRWSTRNGIVYSRRPMNGRLAFMFPGEGSQYLGMLADLALYFDEVREWFDFWKGLYDDPPGESRTDILFPPRTELTEERRKALEERLHDMDVGSEAVFIASQAIHTLLDAFGVKPDVLVGHSTGESTALAAAGAIPCETPARLAEFVRELNRVYRRVLEEGKIPTGALLAVGALPQSAVAEQMAAIDAEIITAMHNCGNQVVLFGGRESIDALQRSLSSAGGICIPLPFDRGYHTPLFSAVSGAFRDYYARIGLQKPGVPLYSCATADLFPEDAEGVRDLAAGQWSRTVRFRETVVRMHDDGVRCFLEVGPSGNLCAFVNDILSGKEHIAVPVNQRLRSGIEQFLAALSHLFVNGRELKLDRLFDARLAVPSDPENGRNRGMPLRNTMPVLHVEDADREALRNLLKPTDTEGARPGDRSDPPLPTPNPNTPEESESDGRVMSGYLHLMRGFLDQQGRIMESYGANPEPRPDEADFPPFLTSIEKSDDVRLEGVCRLNVYKDNFLRDHILSGAVSEVDPDLLGLSCVPLAVSLEIMAEACAVPAGRTDFKTIENIAASSWIALEEGEIALRVHAEAIDSKKTRWRARLTDGGRTAVTADFCFESDGSVPSLPMLTEKRPFRWEAPELYRIGMFHGPIFQSIRRIDGWNDRGIDAGLSEVSLGGFFEKGGTPDLILNPVLLDALGQLSAYWIAQQAGTDFNCFPSTIERIELYRPSPRNARGLTLRARQKPLDSSAAGIEAPRSWDFECLDGDKKPVLRVKNLINIHFQVPNRFYRVRHDPLNGWLGNSVSPLNGKAMLWRVPHISEGFCSQSGGIFLRILAFAILNAEERLEWRELTGNARHRREWLLGRACIKEAVRHWIFRQTGKLLYPSDVVVLHDERGAPYVGGWWNGDLIEAPEVSLSHENRLSMVALTPPNRPVGIDVENLGRVKRADLIEGALSARERAFLKGLAERDVPEKVLRMWCAKEAAAKYLGIGLKGEPREFEVSFPNQDWKLAHVTHNGTRVEVAVACEGESICALATSHRDEGEDLWR